MALRAVIEHPKFHNLTVRLGLERWGGLGILESMWHFCGRFTPAGDIGKYSDAEIESWIGWKGEPGKLIEALVSCRWLDADPVHRLIVHDWAKHADDATKLAVKRANITFVVPTSQVQNGKLSLQCRDSVTTPSGLPEPEPEPEPVSPLTPQGGKRSRKEKPEPLNESWPPTLVALLPPEVQTKEVAAAIELWAEHRRQRRLASYTPLGVKQLAGKIRGWSAEEIVAGVEYSVANNWQGLFKAPPVPSTGEPADRRLTPEEIAMVNR